MKTRIFKFNSYDNFNDEIRFIDESEIQKGYNLHGYLRLDENFKENLEEYREERNNAFEEFKEENENYSLDDVKDFLEDFIDDYEYDTSFSSLAYYRPKKYVVYEDEESIFSESDLEDFRDLDGSEIDASSCVCEFITEWDGNNLKTTYLWADWYDTNIEEITDEYEGIEERWVEIYSHRGNTSGYNIKYDEETDTMWMYRWSAYQGDNPDYIILDAEDRIEYTIKSIYDSYVDTPQILIDELLKEFGGLLNDGEEVYIDNDSVCFKYRNEQYHFETEEFYKEFQDDTSLDINNALDIAREAII